jgi:linoleoyl-CoA desaturase
MNGTASYLSKTSFHRELQARVDQYFKARARSRKGNTTMYVKTAIMLAWLAGSYGLLVFVVTTPAAAIMAAISLGLAMAGIGFNVQHDGGHGSYSENPRVNRIMALTLDLLGGTAYFWHYNHNLAHHTHTNVDGHDDDINVGVLGRMSPHQRWYAHHRFQHLYVWLLYALLAIEWQLTGEFRNYFTKDRYGHVLVPRPTGRERAIFWLGKLVFFALAFAIPLARHPIGNVLALYLVAGATLGLVLAVVFQLAHCTEAAVFRQVSAPSFTVPRGWAEHQVESTVNFARGNRWLNWYLGGLNFQIEHHLFPKICHVHYPALAPLVEEICRAHGVRYFAHPTMRQALASHTRWLRALGNAPDTVAQPASPLPL